MSRKLQLFVFTSFCPDYTDGLAFAIAHDEEQAKNLIQQAYGHVYNWGDMKVYPLNQTIAFAEGGGG